VEVVESTADVGVVIFDAAAAASINDVGNIGRSADGDDDVMFPEAMAAAAARADGGDGEGPNEGGSGRSCAAKTAAAVAAACCWWRRAAAAAWAGDGGPSEADEGGIIIGLNCGAADGSGIPLPLGPKSLKKPEMTKIIKCGPRPTVI